jgi:hypothetical protein
MAVRLAAPTLAWVVEVEVVVPQVASAAAPPPSMMEVQVDRVAVAVEHEQSLA